MSRFVGEQRQHVQRVVKDLKIRRSNDSPEGEVTDVFGAMTFDAEEADRSTRYSQYIRLALDTSPEVAVKFIRQGWRLETTDLIVSIAGGAKNFDLPARLRKAFQLGIVSAAATTKAWIITQGTNAGVVAQVGEALNKYRYTNQKEGLDIPCIGIASWGYTAGKEQLDRSASVTARPTDANGNLVTKRFKRHPGIDALNPTGDAAYSVHSYSKLEQKQRCDLEPNHTHFLLFDDGTAISENVLDKRDEIQNLLRRSDTSTGVTNTPTPIVLVLLEGGRRAIHSVCKALASHTPVVVVNNSGRAADLIAQLYPLYEEDRNDYSSEDELKDDRRTTQRLTLGLTARRLRKIDPIFTKFRQMKDSAWVDRIRDQLCAALRNYKHLITIFDFDSPRHSGKLEDAILDAVLSAAKSNSDTNEQRRSAAELRLALAWRNIDYARRAIFNDSTKAQWTTADFCSGLVDAIRRGYVDFIELFIEYGTTFEKLTVADLERLYSTASTDEVLPLKKTIRNALRREDFYESYVRDKNQIPIQKNPEVVLGEVAARELYFWALFLNRFDFSIYLCSKTWNQCVALIYGARIYQKAARMTLDSESKQQHQTNAQTLDRYAAVIIDRCFDVDREFAVDLLQRPANAFNNVKPLELALKANCRAFLASRCVQRHLDNEWYGNINYKRQNINIRIFLCCLFFPLLPFFCPTLPFIYRHQGPSVNQNIRSKDATANTTYSTVNTGSVRWNEKLRFFYRAPVVRFYYNLFFFFMFLGLFSYVILVDFFPLNVFNDRRSGILNLPIPITEMWLHVWVWGIIVEELRQAIQTKSYTDYLEEMSNIIDLSAISLYFIGFLTRFIVIEEFFIISKITLGFDLILWYIRILHLFAAYERLGPKLIMIFKTMKDLLFFVCFILIFLFGFSITSWALIMTSSQIQWIYDPNGTLANITISESQNYSISWKLLRDVTNYGVWKVFGQVDLVEVDNSYSAVTFILAILFVAISNVLLLNVLVALFNVTIENVQEQSHNIWRYQRYLVVNEFRHKSLLPPPFNTFYCIISALFGCIKSRAKPSGYERPNDQQRLTIGVHNTTVQGFKITEAMQRETAIAEDFWREILKKDDFWRSFLQKVEEKTGREFKKMFSTGP